MEEDLRQLVQACFEAFPRNGLTPDVVGAFCEKHRLDLPQFYLAFAKHVALEFAHGEIGYSVGDCAMNAIVSYAEFEVDGLPWEVFSAFDSGEFYRQEDPPGTVPWQKYTLPEIMKILAREDLLPRA